MKIKKIIKETFQDYKEVSMLIAFPYCSFKCCKDGGFDISVCQNSPLALKNNIEISCKEIYNIYNSNKITNAIVLGGLEPFDSFNDAVSLISYFRNIKKNNDTIVIYTGYKENEIQEKLNIIKQFDNIIIKFGRFIPNQEKHFDELLGVYLASDNQFAKKIKKI